MTTVTDDRGTAIGEQVDVVTLDIDYQIIEHFSENLYGSPNKAVEELVANGFDAFATEVDVYVPGRFSPGRLLVWDNGESMDIQGLKQLWWIARSPKDEGDRVRASGGKTRKMIGKFGIGKLASYAVGNVISHLCRNGDDFYLVSIDYNRIHGTPGGPPVSKKSPMTSPILRLDHLEAWRFVESLFQEPPSGLDRRFARETWTLAIVEDLKIDNLPVGRLKWVLGNGMPLRPDFVIRVNEEPVTPKLAKAAVVDWDFGSVPIVSSIRAHWDKAVKDGRVAPVVGEGREKGLDPSDPEVDVPFVEFKHLGRVWGAIRLFDETLLKYRSAENGRSHGFFMFVRGRLINPDDDLVLLGDPSFQTFYRSQFVLNVDGLDKDLLADRERLRRDSATQELELLQSALYLAARTELSRRDDERADEESTLSILPVRSRPYFREPLNALLMRTPPDEATAFDPAKPKVERKPVSDDAPLAVITVGEGAFHVNTLHPYYRALEKRFGRSRAAKEFLRAYDLFAVSERLLEGHLLDLGMGEAEVAGILEWRDGLFRELAHAYEMGPADVIAEMYRTSYLGDRPFEKALRNVFQDMGFHSEHDGGSGKKDVLVLASVGPESYMFTVEAKGSKGSVDNKTAAVGAAANHRDQVGAEHAVIIAREFAGFGPDGDSEDAAVLKECRATGGVSIMTIDAIALVHKAIDRFGYPLAMLRDIFMTAETPAAKLSRIHGLSEPTVDFDYAGFLHEVWRRQGGEAEGDSVPYKSVYQQTPTWREAMSFKDFELKLVALDTLAAGRIRLATTPKEILLRQAPERILHQIERALRGDGTAFTQQEK